MVLLQRLNWQLDALTIRLALLFVKLKDSTFYAVRTAGVRYRYTVAYASQTRAQYSRVRGEEREVR